ncbi:hypothetical protein HKX48_005395 [Thoreauomyces humboldtii]|nr:hypothetical protein HKX48_005395 [Thoreauomyces humboldtii]
MSARPKETQLLILGLGWSGKFVSSALDAKGIDWAATTTSGRDGSIPFNFDPLADDATPFEILPAATTVLVTFPLRGADAAKRLTDNYARTHPNAPRPNYILLGSTRPWSPPKGSGGDAAAASVWVDRHSKPNPDVDAPRQEAEAQLLGSGGCVLNLAGLWGGERDPRNWVDRVAKDRTALRDKGSLHLVHGEDVAQACIALHRKFTAGERWLLTDLRVYDWWDLASVWGTKQAGWVVELMRATGTKGLPRPAESLGRAVSSLDFWEHFDILPLRPNVRL